MSDQHHEMILEKTHISGVEEWFCPSCGRRFLVQWPPAYKIIVLKDGDKDTRHNLSRLNSARQSTRLAQAEKSIEEFRLTPWRKWMEDTDFDRLWDRDL
jgi:hypothetical protein